MAEFLAQKNNAGLEIGEIGVALRRTDYATMLVYYLLLLFP